MHNGPSPILRAKASRHDPRGKYALLAIALAIGVIMSPSGVAQGEPVIPKWDEIQHLGVASCAGSNCHGAVLASEEATVLQNEFFTWRRYDQHSRAWDTLQGEKASRIAERLGLDDPAQADTCLDCHADNVPPEQRGQRFRFSDGVGCEACHGGAEDWIHAHTDPEATRSDNLARGMYPTEDPDARARLCMSCHYGHPDSPMTHRLMSAGHPPLQFDLDVFTHIQPAHYRIDEDYLERKQIMTGLEGWVTGKAASAAFMLETLASGLADHARLFPEFYHFQCSACHRSPGEEPRGQQRGNLPPGSLALEDAPLRLLAPVIDAIDSSLGSEWSDAVENLHAATGEDATAVRAATDRLIELTRTARQALEDARLDDSHVRAMMRYIVEEGVRADFADRNWAEQATMALASLLAVADEAEWLAPEERPGLDSALDTLYDVLDEPAPHPAARYREALQAFASELD